MELVSFDESYLTRLKNDDPQTVEHFVAYFGELLLIKLRARRLQPADILDARQETFARVFAALRVEGKIRQAASLGPYVNSICNNVLQESFRAGKRAESFGDDPPDVVDKSIDILDDLTKRQLAKLVREVLATLPSKESDILKAVFLEETDRDAVCCMFDVDREYLRVLVHRAKERFRGAYLKKHPEPNQSVTEKKKV